MVSPQGVQKILHAYARRNGSPHVTVDVFVQFAQRFAKRFSAEQPEYDALLQENSDGGLMAGLEELERNRLVECERDAANRITAIYYTAYFTSEIARWYKRMSDDKELPFPAEEHLETTVPADLLRTVEVADNLMHFLQSEEESTGQILLLRFPTGIRDAITTVKLLREDMLPLVMAKIRDYLRTDRNGGYMETKLRSVFRNREMLVHEIIESTQTRPDDAIKMIREPNEFQFHFWTQMSSLIIKEYGEKTDKLDMEHGFCQAAYLLGYYAVFYKGKHQDERQREETHRLLTMALQKPPYAFTVSDVHKLTDDRGVALTKRVPREEVNRWLEEMLQRPSSNQISELVTINTPERNGLMVHSAQYVPLLLRQIKAAAPVVRRSLINKMYHILLEERDDQWVRDDAVFEEEVERTVRDDFSLLYGLATFQTLFLVIDGQELPSGHRDASMALIDSVRKRMRPWGEILRISRTDVFKEARLRLPAWMLIPILRGIVRLLRKMFAPPSDVPGARRRGATTAGPDTIEDASDGDSRVEKEAKRERFRQTIAELQKEFLDGGETPDQRLKKLKQQWNPLIDPTAANNLVEDVNSLCRDTLRRMRYTRTLRVPTLDQIDELAKRIAGNSAFDRIRRREAFQIYLKLYMLTILHRS